jgi:hypothetical protein
MFGEYGDIVFGGFMTLVILFGLLAIADCSGLIDLPHGGSPDWMYLD